MHKGIAALVEEEAVLRDVVVTTGNETRDLFKARSFVRGLPCEVVKLLIMDLNVVSRTKDSHPVICGTPESISGWMTTPTDIARDTDEDRG